MMTTRKTAFVVRSAGVCALSIALCTHAHAAPGDVLRRIVPDPGYASLQFGTAIDLRGGQLLVAGEGIFTDPTPGGAYLYDASSGALLTTFPQPVHPGDIAPVDARFVGCALAGPLPLPGGGTARLAVIGTDRIGSCSCYGPLVRVFSLATPSSPELIWDLRPDDAAFDDDFGTAIATDGALALIGAPAADINGPLSGAAYLFDLTTGEQIARILPGVGTSLASFGYDVDLHDGIAIIGARWDSEVASRAGAAYLFDLSDPASPVQLAKLIAPDADAQDYFGSCVAIRGGVALVGSFFDDELGLDAGAAYAYDVTDPASPVLGQKILASDGAANDDFGWDVALDVNPDGSVSALISARTDDDAGPGAGSVAIYNLTDPASPVFVDEILPDTVTGVDTFGWSVALDGGIAAIGAPGADDLANSSGAAFLVDAAGLGCTAADLAEPYGTLDLADINAFVAGFTGLDPIADLDGNGLFDLGDITDFIASFGIGCP